jgi:hypothetical protein
MRRGLLVIALLGCSHAAPTGPAWPKPHAAESDGGESLAPREAARASAAAVEDDRAADRAADKPAATPPAATPSAATPPAGATADKPAAGSVTVTEEPLTAEELVIEVDDPDRP